MLRSFILFLVTFGIIGCGSAPLVDSSEQTESETPSFSAAEALVADLTPFVNWTRGDTNIEFNESAAREAGLPEARIQLGIKLAYISRDVAKNVDLSTISAGKSSLLRPQDAAISLTFSWITPLTEAAFQAFFVSLGDVCPTPRFPAPITSYASRATAISRLTAVGFRYTLSPTGACAVRGPAAYGQLGGDYTKPLYYSVAGSASLPCYRYQGVVSMSAPWTFQVQGAAPGGTSGTREPNPEICEYTWPTWWWGAYTAYFHMIRC